MYETYALGRRLRSATTALAAAALLSAALLPLAAGAQEAGQHPKISIGTINDRIWPFKYDCGDALMSPIRVTGSGADAEPSGRIEQYSVQIDWGDGAVEPAAAAFKPPSGQGGFTMAWSAGAHSYATSGSKTVTVTLYHSELAGNDNIKIESASATICIAPTDADKDGMDDRWETEHGLSPSEPTDAAKDDDGDGVYNLDEYEKHGDPSKPDTDGDGMPDKWEFDHKLLLDQDDGKLDPDKDGRDNLTEYNDGTDPQKADKAAGWLTRTAPIFAGLALLAILAVILLKRRPNSTGPLPAKK